MLDNRGKKVKLYIYYSPKIEAPRVDPPPEDPNYKPPRKQALEKARPIIGAEKREERENRRSRNRHRRGEELRRDDWVDTAPCWPREEESLTEGGQ